MNNNIVYIWLFVYRVIIFEPFTYLITIKKNISRITSTDKAILKDFEVEFEYDMYGKTNDQNNLFTKSGMNNLFNWNKQKHLYFYKFD
mgnify:CR=1 FL=1